MRRDVIFAACIAGSATLMSSFATALGAPEEPAESAVFAQRGGAVLYRHELDAYLATIPSRYRAGVVRSAEALEEIVENLMLSQQLVAAAMEAGYDKHPIVRRRMALAAEEELAKAWMDHYLDNVKDADYEAMAREYYLTHKTEFMSPLNIDVTHLLIGIERRSLEEARALAAELHEQVQRDPARFDQLVLEYSEDPSVGSNKGRFTNVQRGSMVRGFEKAAFDLAPGEISGPVRSRYGYHLIRLDARNEPQLNDFDEVNSIIRARMVEEHREEAKADYLRQLQLQPLEITDAALEDLASDYFDLAEAGGKSEPGEGVN